jgi:hypothetical protein
MGWFVNTFRNCFHLEHLTNGFLQLFQLCFHIAHGHIPPQIACVLRAAHLLAMTKFSGVVHPITVGGNGIDSQTAFYVFNSMKLLQHIFPHTNLELQLRVVVKQ